MGIRPVVCLSPTPVAGAIHLPVIAPVFWDAVIDLSDRDAVIFTSKQAVYALERLTPEWKELPAFSVGRGTSEAIHAAGGTLFFESSRPYGDTLAEEVTATYANRRFFYPRAAKVVSNLENIFSQNGVDLKSTIVYETRCQPIDTAAIPHQAAIVFTAPSTVACFLARTPWQPGWVAVAIGDRTAEALSQKGIPCHTAPQANLHTAATFAGTI
jgi:uroporphyrinogen-III synthase